MDVGTGIGIGFFLVWGFFVLLAISAFAFWIWMLVDCLTKVSDKGNDKLIWALVIIFTHWLGALIYFIVQRPKNKVSTESLTA